MLNIKSFKGYFYNRDKAGQLNNLVAPPYDVIEPDYREKLATSSEFNIANLLLPEQGETADYYQRVKNSFSNWIKQNIIVQDTSPDFYFLKQTFSHKNRKNERIGFLGLMDLKDVKNVIRHEHIIKKYSEDRKRLIEITKTNLEPVFFLYEDDEFLLNKAVENADTFQDVEFENVKNSFGKIKNTDFFSRLVEKIKNGFVYIADGHHRFSASLKSYMENPGNAPQNVLVYFTNLLSENLIILPTHRLVYNDNITWSKLLAAITPYFSIERFIDFSSLKEALSTSGPNSFGVYGTGRFYLWKLINIKNIEKFLPYSEIEEWKRLDAVILHHFILKEILKLSPEEKIFYEKDENLVFEKAKSGPRGFAFFLNPTDINDIKIISQKGGVLPAKTTYFYPKIPSGLIFYKSD
ncbi:MAG: DUF1015 domain-containing protein [Candidatus Omnitrophica bacterium]|nr:DUF1015 domain-containing protein [Candidatus Omnitrophota bacterium]